MLDKLEFLLALAREQHFGRAAESCGVTQPTLSAGVKQLEEAFGVLLVNRGSRFQGFTPEGERVLEWARRIVGDTRAMRQEVHALKHGLAGRLRHCGDPDRTRDGADADHAISRASSRKCNSRSCRAPRLRSSRIWKISKSMLASPTSTTNRSGASPACRSIMSAIGCSLAADAPLGDRESVTWAEVAQVPLCLLTPDMQNRRIIERLLRDAGSDPRIDARIRIR